MTERAQPSLLRVSGPRTADHHVSYTHERSPMYIYPGNGYGYGPHAGGFLAHTVAIKSNGSESLSMHHEGRGVYGISGLHLGSESNKIDVFMWGVPNNYPVTSDTLSDSELHTEEGKISGGREGVFDRRIVVPIFAGALSLYLASAEWTPTQAYQPARV